MVLLSLWVGKTRLDASFLDKRSFSRMEKRPKVVFVRWINFGVLLLLWLPNSVVNATESQNAPMVYSTRRLEVAVRSAVPVYSFKRSKVMTIFDRGNIPFTAGRNFRTFNPFTLSEKNGVSFFDSLRPFDHKVLGTLDQVGTNFWLYIGKDDPLCHIYVTYSDTLWEKHDPQTFCLKYMHRDECTYLSHSLEKIQKHGFFSDSVTLHCFGLRGHYSDIEHHRTKDWTQLYTMSPYGLVTLHGEFMFYRDQKNNYHWVTPGIIIAGVVFHNKTITGIEVKDHKWTRVNREVFTLARAPTLESLMEKVTFFSRVIGRGSLIPQTAPVEYVPCECDKISWVESQLRIGYFRLKPILGLEIVEKSSADTYVIPSCEFQGGSLRIGNCSLRTIEHFMTDSHLQEEDVDESKSWYTSLLQYFFDLLKSFVAEVFTYMIKFLLDYVISFGSDVIVGFIIPYLAIVKVYGNLPAILISTVCTLLWYNSHDLASEWN